MKPTRYLIGLLALIFGLACQVSARQASEVHDQDVPEAFNYAAFLNRHRKAYKPVESIARAKLFLKRTLDIIKANVLFAAHKSSHYLRQNEFIDQTPEEIKGMLLNTNNDLLPVKEALISPDTPADQFITGKAKESQINDAMTKSSSNAFQSAYTSKSPLEASSSFASAGEFNDFDPSELIKELQAQPQLAARMSKFIEIQSDNDDDYQAKLERKAKNVAFKPIIEATNKQFDPSLMETRGFADSAKDYNEFYANVMMDDFLGYLQPYPEPPPSDDTPQKNNDHDRGILSGFIDSLKNFQDFFLMAEDDDLFDRHDCPKKNVKSTDEHKNSDTLDDDSRKTGTVYNIDWRQTGCISRVKNQSKCNACYAFATLDLIEYFYCREMKSSTEFSAQYIIDCGAKAGLNGCEGGRLSGVKSFINSYGLQANSLYPYTARDQVCPYDEADEQKAFLVKPLIKRWAMFSEIQAWYKWVAKSPIIVGINMPADFLAYGGGVHSGADCTAGMVHALLLVGAGKQDGHPFWLLKNTFSDEWGEGGYFRLSRKAPIKCFNSAVVARVTFRGIS